MKKSQASIDTWFTFPVCEQNVCKIKGMEKRYSVKINGTLLPLPFKTRKKFVEISARELILCFARH